MSEISLTASMRSNLLSLQQISKLQDSTQLRLSTGLKVNSAIDNPSSYYTASSLNNRAEDLSALLDSMGQSVQTIKAATEGIEKAEELLAIAQATANSALEDLKIPEKSYFESLVGENGAVVSSKEELINAVKAGKEEICIYGEIDMGDQNITLKDNQKLVGIGYYGKFDSDTDKFSSLKFEYDGTGSFSAISSSADNNIISDLSIDVKSNGEGQCIYLNSANNTLAQNIDIKTNIRGLYALGSNNTKIDGKNFFDLSENDYIYAIDSSASSVVDIYGETTIRNEGSLYNYAISNNANIYGKLNIYTKGTFAFDVTTQKGNITFKSGSEVNMMGYNIMSILQSDSTPGAMIFETGARLNYQDQGSFVASKDITLTGNVKPDPHIFITADYIRKNLADFTETEYSWEDFDFKGDNSLRGKVEDKYTSSFNKTLSQYDSLIKDSSYKGVNLLQADDLKVIFNENRSATLDVMGVDLSSDKIGLITADWLTADDVQKTIEQLSNAKNTLRSASTKLGNYYSIITERETFTDNLINVLEEGADKLTLADMNEESANMLSLQTQQQLAINSLSLASQASQAVLRLF